MAEAAFFRARHRRGRFHRHRFLAVGALGLGLIGSVVLAKPRPLVIYNASASAPIGFYRVLPLTALWKGELVLVSTPRSVRQLAAERDYLPASVPLVKRIEALGGDTVCAHDRDVTINGHYVARQLAADSLGRPLPDWSGCQTLGPHQVFLLMKGVPDSFDSRYFGPVPTRSIIGRLLPLWRR